MEINGSFSPFKSKFVLAHVVFSDKKTLIRGHDGILSWGIVHCLLICLYRFGQVFSSIPGLGSVKLVFSVRGK